ncbi:MAG: DUF2318 domain-containing protein [Pseudomonadota bacterium]
MTKYIATLSPVVAGFILISAAVCMLVPAGHASAWNFTIAAPEIKPINGFFTIPASSLADGNARYFTYTHSPNQKIRFFAVKSRDGVVRAAFDACDVCYRAKKGYVQQGDAMVCVNCGMKFRTDKINEVSGGCNPAALNRSVKGDMIVISVNDVLAGVKYFQ